MHTQMFQSSNKDLLEPVPPHHWRHLIGKLLIALSFITFYVVIFGAPWSEKLDAEIAIAVWAVIALGVLLLETDRVRHR
jgi:hypothetical protein